MMTSSVIMKTVSQTKIMCNSRKTNSHGKIGIEQWIKLNRNTAMDQV